MHYFILAKDFSEDTCVAVVVLTHGVEGNLGTFDIPFSEEELYNPFSDKRHPALIGKPKFFFLQVVFIFFVIISILYLQTLE